MGNDDGGRGVAGDGGEVVVHDCSTADPVEFSPPDIRGDITSWDEESDPADTFSFFLNAYGVFF